MDLDLLSRLPELVNGIPQVAPRQALSIVDEYRDEVIVGANALAGLVVAPRYAFPAWALKLRERGRQEGNSRGLEAYRLIPYPDKKADPARATLAFESFEPHPYYGVYLEFHFGEFIECVVAGHRVAPLLDVLGSEYGASEVGIEAVSDLKEVLWDAPDGAREAGLTRLFQRYELAGGAGSGIGTATLLDFGGHDPLDGPLTRITNAIRPEKGERAMIQIFLRPATGRSLRALERGAENFKEHPDAPPGRGLVGRAWDQGVMALGSERGRDKVRRRDDRLERDRRAAEGKSPKDSEDSRHVADRRAARRHFEVSFSALGWVESGRRGALSDAFDSYFERFSSEGRAQILRVGRAGRAAAAELRAPGLRTSRWRGNPLVIPAEVSAVWHALGEHSRVENRRRSPLITKSPPIATPKEGLCVGTYNHGNFDGKPLYIPVASLDTHGDGTGKTGKGKSSFYLELMRGIVGWPYFHDLEAEAAGEPSWRRATTAGDDEAEKMGLLLLDPKGGELVTELVSLIPEWRLKDVVVVDVGDPRFAVPRINFFDPMNHMEIEDQAATIVDGLEQRFPAGFGANMRPIFVAAALACIAANKKLKDAGLEPRFSLLSLTETGFLAPRIEDGDGGYEQPPVRAEALNHLRGDPEWAEVVAYWDAKDDRQSAKDQAKEWNPITNKIAHFKNSKVRRLIGEGRSDIDFMEALEKGRILLFNLSKGALPADFHKLLGTLVLNLLCRTAAIRHDRAVRAGAAHDLRRFTMVVDEAQNFACPEMTTTLTEGRSQKTPLWVAHQYVNQFSDKELLGALANVGTRIHFGTTSEDAKAVSQFVPDPRFSPAAIEGLPKYNFVTVRDDVQENLVMTGRTLRMPDVDKAAVDRVRAASAKRYASSVNPLSVQELERHLSLEVEFDLPAEAPSEAPDETWNLGAEEGDEQARPEPRRGQEDLPPDLPEDLLPEDLPPDDLPPGLVDEAGPGSRLPDPEDDDLPESRKDGAPE